MQRIDKAKVKRMLVITLTNVGDIILTTPVVEALIKEFPDARLDVMVGPSGRDIFEAHEKVSEVVIYDKRSGSMDKFRLFLKLRKKHYDLVADLRNTVLPLVLGARYNTSPFGRGFETAGMHKKDVHLSRLKNLGVDVSGAEFRIPMKGNDKEHVDRILGDLKEKPFIAVSPGAKSHVKRWPLKHFARLCDILKEDLGYEVVLIGDKNDRVVIERILFNMKAPPLNLIEKLNIRALAYLIRKSSLLITNDSAPLHVGSAVGARILAFFGPTDQKKYGPLTKAGSIVLKEDLECSPCEVPQCVNTDRKYECLRSVSVKTALEAAKELL